jgi:ABC-type cobalt transport system substrate-binding protein
MKIIWTDGQTNESVRKQKKVLYIVIPVIAALFIYHNIMKDELYAGNMQQIIEQFCKGKDYNKLQLSHLCNSNSLEIENKGEIYLFSCENEETCLS